MSKIDYLKNSEILKALSNPIRLQMVDFLLDDECCVTDVVNELGISQSASSQHLAILKNSGIVYPKKHGTRTCYKVHDNLTKEIITLLKKLNND
ncbi:MAG: transcriptional regulator [Bacteroidetes bacterium HGW-Bacteroidetes-3]|jgi:ArsR family transcriptional regulator|nr:MAG: transcriptional regulator [Bacteroidetes bacterium HGW-Bacteroidetes-3]